MKRRVQAATIGEALSLPGPSGKPGNPESALRNRGQRAPPSPADVMRRRRPGLLRASTATRHLVGHSESALEWADACRGSSTPTTRLSEAPGSSAPGKRAAAARRRAARRCRAGPRARPCSEPRSDHRQSSPWSSGTPRPGYSSAKAVSTWSIWTICAWSSPASALLAAAAKQSRPAKVVAASAAEALAAAVTALAITDSGTPTPAVQRAGARSPRPARSAAPPADHHSGGATSDSNPGHSIDMLDREPNAVADMAASPRRAESRRRQPTRSPPWLPPEVWPRSRPAPRCCLPYRSSRRTSELIPESVVPSPDLAVHRARTCLRFGAMAIADRRGRGAECEGRPLHTGRPGQRRRAPYAAAADIRMAHQGVAPWRTSSRLGATRVDARPETAITVGRIQMAAISEQRQA